MIQTTLKDRRENDKERLLKTVSLDGKRITVIVGLSKNAGKTTFLNWLLDNTSFSKKGIITTGRDGEDIDVIEKVSKPKVTIPAGSIFSTSAPEIKKKGAYLHLLEKLPYKAGGKNIWLVRSDLPLEVEITGPPSITEQIDTAERIIGYGADHVFIDGSLDRKAIGSAADADSLIVAGSPVCGSLSELKSGFRKIYELTKIGQIIDISAEIVSRMLLKDECVKLVFGGREKNGVPEIKTLSCKTLLGSEKEIVTTIRSFMKKRNELSAGESKQICLYLPTSLTEKSFLLIKALLNSVPELKIIIKHPFHLQLEDSSFNWLLQREILMTVRKLEIAGFVVNSHAVNGNHLDCRDLRKEIREEFPLPVVDVREI